MEYQVWEMTRRKPRNGYLRLTTPSSMEAYYEALSLTAKGSNYVYIIGWTPAHESVHVWNSVTETWTVKGQPDLRDAVRRLFR